MITFENLLRAWVWLALTMTVAGLYLTVNKIWIRRHEAVVADSISVSAKLLAIFAATPYFLLYVIQGPYESAVVEIAFIGSDIFLIVIGIGLWVEGRRGRGFWANLKSALKLERREATALLKDVFHPVAAGKLIRILRDFAMIDREFDARERAFIETFSNRWNIDLDQVLAEREQEHDGTPAAFVSLRKSVERYLAMTPPVEQAQQLGDVLSSLTRIDEKTTEEEEIILEELLGLIQDYVGGTESAGFLVLIAPQSRVQEEALKAIRPDLPKEKRLGGEVFRIGRYYSQVYADMVCGWYRESGYLTVTSQYEPEHRASPALSNALSAGSGLAPPGRV